MCSQYLNYKLIDSNAEWKEKWYYIGNHDPKLPKLIGHRPIWNNHWIDEPNTAECLQVLELMNRIAELKQQGLTGIGVAFSCVTSVKFTNSNHPLNFVFKIF